MATFECLGSDYYSMYARRRLLNFASMYKIDWLRIVQFSHNSGVKQAKIP